MYGFLVSWIQVTVAFQLWVVHANIMILWVYCFMNLSNMLSSCIHDMHVCPVISGISGNLAGKGRMGAQGSL